MSFPRMILICSATALLVCSIASAQREPARKSDGARPRTQIVPVTPFDVMRQCLNLKDPALAKRVGDLQTEYGNDRQERIWAVEAQINAEYAERVARTLDEKSRETFEKVSAAAAAYYRASAEAKAAFDKTWRGISDAPPPSYVPAAQSLVNFMPGLTGEQRNEIGARANAVIEPFQKLVQDEAAKQGVVPPADRGDREASRLYFVRIQEIQDRIMAELQVKYVEEARRALPENLVPKYDAAVAAIDAHKAAREKALDDYERILTENVSPEKMQQNSMTHEIAR